MKGAFFFDNEICTPAAGDLYAEVFKICRSAGVELDSWVRVGSLIENQLDSLTKEIRNFEEYSDIVREVRKALLEDRDIFVIFFETMNQSEFDSLKNGLENLEAYISSLPILSVGQSHSLVEMFKVSGSEIIIPIEFDGTGETW